MHTLYAVFVIEKWVLNYSHAQLSKLSLDDIILCYILAGRYFWHVFELHVYVGGIQAPIHAYTNVRMPQYQCVCSKPQLTNLTTGHISAMVTAALPQQATITNKKNVQNEHNF